MSRRLGALLALALLLTGCAVPAGSGSSRSDGPRTRCLSNPGRGESVSGDRPLFFFFCVESP